VHPSPPDQDEMAFAPGASDRSADEIFEDTGYFTILKDILVRIKNPAVEAAGFYSSPGCGLVGDGYVAGLQALGTAFDRELDPLAFSQVAEAFALDGGVVDENIFAALALDESVTLAAIEPLNRADDTFRHCIYSLLHKTKNWLLIPIGFPWSAW
jgi:hypothetical protein